MLEYILKEDLRKKILMFLRSQKEESRIEKSFMIREKLFKAPEYQRASTVLFYASFDGEVDTSEMIKQSHNIGKKIGLPRIVDSSKTFVPTYVENLEEDIEQGPYGIRQPKDPGGKALCLENIDVVIVPGIAFDKTNNRLGRGGGYYDRFLKKLPSDIPTLGLAFDFQIVDHLPHQEGHDMPVSRVLVN
jgi:5-formyltetrahydrofolate cyclo-ligase